MRKREENLNTASGLHIAMVLLGIAVTPVLLSSSSLGDQLSSGNLISVVLLGGVILTLLSVITTSMGEEARLPAYGVMEYSLDEKGAIVTNILTAISLFGWIAVTANMFGRPVHDLLAQHGLEVPLTLLVAVGCIIFAASTAFDFIVLGKVTQVVVSVVALALCHILCVATHTKVAVPAAIVEMDVGVVVSTVVDTIIVLATTLSDFGSFVRNHKHALIATGVAFLVAYPLLYWVGATPSTIGGQGSLLGATAVFGAVLPATLSLIFVCVVGNAGNMFQGTLMVSTLLTRFPEWQVTVALGILSAIVGSMDIMAWFVPFLLSLGIVTPPVTRIYIADFFLYCRNGH